jgi:hypothetical protein
MKIFIILALVYTGLSSPLEGIYEGRQFEEKVEVSGNIYDLATGEALTGASITLINEGKTVFTDFDGNFTLVLPRDKSIALKVEYISYQKKIIREIKADGTENLRIGLKEKKEANEPVSFSDHSKA